MKKVSVPVSLSASELSTIACAISECQRMNAIVKPKQKFVAKLYDKIMEQLNVAVNLESIRGR